jgi:Na+:H+ antiporter, NhaA family
VDRKRRAIVYRSAMALTETFKRFASSEQFAGVLLIACTVISLALANSPLAAAYLALGHAQLGGLTVEHWINDALMAVFFLLIGLELERELYVGELSRPRHALLPVFAAVGGMAVPAAIHLGLNAGAPTQSGFGIPMATDIAFALGVLALLGNRVPPALKVFVVAFAVIDDLGAIVLIATVYTEQIAWTFLALALGTFGLLIALNRSRVMALPVYLAGGVLLWIWLREAGIHASIAGVLLAFAIPFTAKRANDTSPSEQLEHALHRPVAWVILPLFALANTAVPVDAAALARLAEPNSIGIVLGLLVGKPLGVVLLSAVAVACRVSALPDDVRWAHVVGAGLLGGIGFTMSIFITNLAFEGEPDIVNASKLAILLASVVAGAAGLAWLRLVARGGTTAANA